MAMKDEVWAWLAKDHEGRLTPAAGELLYEAHGLARRLDATLVAVTDSKPDAPVRTLLKAWQVKQTRVLKHAPAPHPLYDGGASPLAELLPADSFGKVAAPRVLLLPADAFGKVAAPLWAAESGATLVTGATGITADTARFVAARPTHGDQFEALVSVPLSASLVVTLLPGAVGSMGVAAKSEEEADAPPRRNAAGIAQASRGYGIHPPDPASLDISDAERIVAFGRGAFSDAAIELVRQLAEKLGAAVAGTRPAADEGWLPFSRQVGLTGAVVRPRLYVAVGISGAPYHMVGVKEPETLVAINRDPDAPIFGSAGLGIVGDLHEVLPRLIEEIGQGRGLDEAAPRDAKRDSG